MPSDPASPDARPFATVRRGRGGASWLVGPALLLGLTLGCTGGLDERAEAATGWPATAPPPLTLPQPSSADRGATRLAIVGTDFQVSGLSWLPLATPGEVHSGVFDSGAAVGAAGAALSGDVLLARTPPPAGGRSGPMLLIDRADGVLSSVRTDGSVQWQRSIADGFFANVQDALEVAPGHVFVVRAQGRPGGPTRGDGLDGGDDLLHLQIGGDGARTRIPLGPHATIDDAHAFGGRMAFDGEGLWVPLASYQRDFGDVGAGRLVRVDPAADAVTAVVDLPEPLRGCVAASYVAGAKRVAVVCVGDFERVADVGAAQRESSGVALVDPALATVTAHASAATLQLPGPVGFSLVALDGGWHPLSLAITSLGSLAEGTPDALWSLTFDGAGGGADWQATKLDDGGEAWTITALAWDRARQRLFYTRHDDAAGDVRALQREGDTDGRGTWTAVAPVVSWPQRPRAFDLGLF